MTNKLHLGQYEHYKGKRYEVLGVARHSETLEELDQKVGSAKFAQTTAHGANPTHRAERCER